MPNEWSSVASNVNGSFPQLKSTSKGLAEMRVWPSIADVSSPRPASETLRPCLISIVSIVRLETVGKTDMKQMYTAVSVSSPSR